MPPSETSSMSSGSSSSSWTQQRAGLQAILHSAGCIRPGSVHDPISARIAAELGFELGMLGGSTASLTVLGDPDLILISLSELAETVHRIARAGTLPVLVDADHGYGNALSVRRTVQELEHAGAAGLSIEDTVLPQAYGQSKPQLISLDEGVGKMQAAVAARRDPAFAIFARTAASITSLDDAIARARAYEQTGVDALFVVGIKKRAELEAFAKATRLPIMLGTVEAEMDDLGYLASQRVRIANQGHLPFAAAAQAVYATLKALREGTAPKDIKGLPSADLMTKWTRAGEATQRQTDFLGIKPKA